jgi:hypothetical protein
MKDFTLVNPGLKEFCLIAYNELTKDENILKAFLASSIKNLHAKASQLLNEDDLSTKDRMISRLRNEFNLSAVQCSYLYNQAVQVPGNKKDKSSASKTKSGNPYAIDMGVANGGLVLDAYALALFIDLNQSGV